MNPLDLVQLTALMERTSDSPDMLIGLIDGPVVMTHPDLAEGKIRALPGTLSGTCTQVSSAACLHGTFVAGVLCAKRTSIAPAICPDCTLLVRPIFAEAASEHGQLPSATPTELVAATREYIEAGARVINLSSALVDPASSGHAN
jgi:hypothetical protein